MELNHLKHFKMIAELGSISRAARAIGLTQPALSAQVQQLEKEAGVELLVRTSRGCSLTPAGLTLAQHAEFILGAVERARAEVRHAGREVTGRLRIGSTNSIATYLLPDVLLRFIRQNPNVDTELFVHRADVVNARVAAGELDLGLSASPAPVQSLAFEQLWRDPILLAVGVSHPWFRRRRVTLQELDGAEFIAFEMATPTGAYIASQLAAHGVHVNVVLTSDQIGTVKRAIEVGLGVGLVPSGALDLEVRSRTLATPELIGITLFRDIKLAYPVEGQPTDGAAESFMALLRDEASRRV